VVVTSIFCLEASNTDCNGRRKYIRIIRKTIIGVVVLELEVRVVKRQRLKPTLVIITTVTRSALVVKQP
jgi:hypothetical protein